MIYWFGHITFTNFPEVLGKSENRVWLLGFSPSITFSADYVKWIWWPHFSLCWKSIHITQQRTKWVCKTKCSCSPWKGSFV